MLGSEIVVAVGDASEAELSLALADDLATAFGLPLRTLHVDATPENVATELASGLAPDSILVIHSEHANRWSGKWSVAEHMIDEWGGIVVAVGPRYSRTQRSGTVLAAVDGSPNARRVIEPSSAVASALDCSVEFCQVVPAASAGRTETGANPTETTVVVGNDPISALLDHGEAAPMIVLAARGDRTSTRSSISRTCSGLIAGAAQPVMIVGTNWESADG